MSGKFVKIKYIDTGYSIVVTCSFLRSVMGPLITQLNENLAEIQEPLEEEVQEIKEQPHDTKEWNATIQLMITTQFYSNADIAIFVFSIDDRDSFFNIEQVWRKEVLAHSVKEVMIILIGNKDNLNEKRINSKSISKEYA
ncbi:PREDICTED: uncharacterized protein LOC105314846 [Amphimedon queenslandica]|uniref:Uncharacterized protein n=1 Tax=Amphimedon queenslandica TaxID=400682 RepID=A0AAN0IRE8_AMPQE|nr:PREDICTED: uncharacterized protein LOC105314846 [Amphimedon queenslandica]|eukprot:XP_011407543.1 PREDICTED: uncharacterized protein LOC105314846 [Amphimedon queenslandica]